jgi:hypothetical protein
VHATDTIFRSDKGVHVRVTINNDLFYTCDEDGTSNKENCECMRCEYLRGT